MEKFLSFLDMGGYASYIWPSYAIALFLLAWIWLKSYKQMLQREEVLTKESNNKKVSRQKD